MSLTLVNLFTVTPEEAESFVARFKAISEKFADAPGFGGTELQRNAGVGDQTYQFVNTAIWESEADWRVALMKILAEGGVVPKAALYESIVPLPAKGAN
ncbi:MAG TPA: antibiotic biosynthesis monooxygenase family protein [Caulobacteraceae bacterium]|nr:antibiotic biosynthesis monooxygenase family protein [Caulobacteraceae bacterium]